jgi:hypothetical protein
MSWERDPLWAKARLFLGRASDTPHDDPAFGLWCSIGLELLARAALASVSPALLAYPDQSQRYVLHAVHKDSEIQSPKSISASLVFDLCVKIFPVFSEEDRKTALALLNRRNEELHSGAAAFDQFNPSRWLVGFYHACQSLCTALGETLQALFGDDEAAFAEKLLTEDRNNLKTTVLSAIADCRRSFGAMTPAEQGAARAKAEELGRDLSVKRHHRVVCSACGCTATVQGNPFGKEHVSHDDDGFIVVRQAVSPTEFSCSACGLKLTTYAALETAGLGDHYTRTTTESPEDYFGLISADEIDSYVEARIRDLQEYDNE